MVVPWGHPVISAAIRNGVTWGPTLSLFVEQIDGDSGQRAFVITSVLRLSTGVNGGGSIRGAGGRLRVESRPPSGYRSLQLGRAGLPLPSVLCSRVSDRLPLEVGDGIGSAAPERDNVILPIAMARTPCEPGRWAGMLALELARYLSGSVLFGSKRGGKGDRNRQRDNCTDARERYA